MNSGYNGARNILLADDDDDDRLLFLDVLKELKVPVHMSSASNGEALMQMLAEGLIPPDILFLDLNMPLKNGFECLAEIRQDARLNNMPVVIFSTSSQPSAIERLYADGAQLYIRKPNDFTQLKSVISEVLGINWKSR